MDLHLALPEGFTHDTAGWLAAPHALATESVQSSTSEDEDEGGAASTIVSFLPLLLIVAAVYFLLLRPRQRQMRQQRELQSTLDVGDEVMLTSGVYGFITGFEPGTDIVWVEVDDDVQIRVSRAAVSGKVTTAVAPAPPSQDGSETPAEPTTATSRRPTLKGGGTKPTRPAAAEPTPGPAPADDSTTGESPDE
jgi:preprotein translocase subunit YajC